MFIRFAAWIATAIAGAFLVVSSSAFAASSIMWLTFAIAIGTLAVSIGLVAGYRKNVATVAAAGATAVLSAWLIVSSLVFSLSVVTALSFSGALGLVGLALVGLTINELAREHVVHTLETTTAATTSPQGNGRRHAVVS